MTRSFRLRVSNALAEDLKTNLVRLGYGPRKKGVWLAEALKRLEKDDPKLMRIGVADDLDVPRTKLLGFALDREAYERLKFLALRVREQTPLLEGVRALVVRTAIRHRIRADMRDNLP